MLVLDYELRKEYIIQVYCVNKSRPEIHCDGKCYLAEQIAKANEQDENQAKNIFFSQVFLFEGIGEMPQFSFALCDKKYLSENSANFVYKMPFTNPPISSFFTPPKSSFFRG